ncbi:MAG TPA: hypothetical protein VH144_02585 [Candidatus Saccharimonadales bacterium]|jgi:hypothetical protein|nr:hypothetical protein [Candidatus Saccharimonadales bacterium]
MTYLPPINGGRINASIGGNTAGASTLISSGTMVLAGGNNIVLSQNANTITISASNQSAQTQSNIQAIYDGTNSISTGTIQYSNANGVSFGINGQTLTASVAAAAAAFSAGISSTIGNTAGVTGLATNRLVFAGGNNVTLSQSTAAGGNTLTISAANQSIQTQNMVSISGSTGNISFNNANNVTFGGNASAITASASFSQTVQTQNLQNIVLSSNTAGAMATISSGTMTLAGGNNITLSQNGNAVTISGGAGGAGVAIAGGGGTFSTGTLNLNASGALTLSSAAQSLNFSVPQTSSLVGAGALNISTAAGNITLSVPNQSAQTQSNIQAFYDGAVSISTGTIFLSDANGVSLGLNGQTLTASIGNTLDFYQNMDRGTSASLGVPYATNAATLMLQRLNQENDEFAAYITANTVLLNMTANMTATSLSTAHTVTAYVGVYANNTSVLNLLNSASSSWALGAATGNTASYNGPRWISFVSSQWSSQPAFSQGAEYVFGVFFRASSYAPPLSFFGQNYMNANQRSGYMGTSIATNATMAQGDYWNAMYTAATTAFPAAISASQVNRNNVTAVFIPHIVLNNRYSGTF